jgi:predicted RNA-binding Zn-ribbon protein involved in translation (DUF1610 family)
MVLAFTSPGSLAMLAAIRRASSFCNCLQILRCSPSQCCNHSKFKKDGSGGSVAVNTVSVNECPQCGGEMIAPERSEHLSDQCTRNVWACEACGYRYEDTIYLTARERVGTD